MCIEEMDTKVLLRLIKDDIKILDNINNSFIDQANLTCEEAEVALARAKALVMEFEMLSKNLSKEEEPQLFGEVKSNHEEEKKEKKVRSLRNFLPFIKSEEEKTVPVFTSNLEDNNVEPGAKDEIEEPGIINPISENVYDSISVPLETSGQIVLQNPDEGKTGDVNIPEIQKEISEKEVTSENITSVKIEPQIVSEKTSGDMKVFGETIGEKHQLVNDLLSQDKSESRFEKKPLKSIREGIGINDRFLFIRELFYNNAGKFDQTLNALDELNGIEDAVKFLKQNFKWNKSEAGEKFLLLIKRRFAK
jgi:hypothetical protein